ncbi:cell wall metabolism sensor histidine kinase WalK [Candidatus Chloroploca sp. Khr17]|uniref:sensor histidine kinase n=1 Tax=Candidatus Chloroploca sp. Khr17 TaxID=2496869 RepID=UPI00101BF5D7|nr:ATP-binding protein [Candidatus Chloroploca sp. Khr17]
MKSLTTRLVLAFAITSLASIGLAAIFVRQFVTTQFDAYVLEQRRDAFLTRVANYYATHGNWDGLTPATLAENRNGEPSGPGGWSPDGDHFERIAFFIADAEGRIVLSPNPLWRGQPARADDLARGTPILVNNEQVGTFVLLEPPLERNPAEEAYLRRTDLALGAAALGAVLVALSLGFILARLMTRPIQDLTRATRALAAGDLGQQVPVRSRDELGLLATQFNAMSADLARATELRQRMTADIAHDLRTPLTVLSGYLEAMRDESLRPTPARFAAMHDETRVLMRLVEDLHTLSLADAGELILKRQPTEPGALLERVATSYQHTAKQQGVALILNVPDGLPTIEVDIEQTIRALNNLVGNALHHTPSGGEVMLAAHRETAHLVFEISDTGTGIAPEHLPNIFERFYRADASRQQATGGSGLGLAIVRSIIAAHGGNVSVDSAPGEGTIFRVRVPLSTPQA